MCTLLEAIGIVLETYFRFGFPNESIVGDSLRAYDEDSSIQQISPQTFLMYVGLV